ncbi:MAG TPA: VWA domain-containing protein [Vicinamibacterales bacterium]|nr:VWA domain-containing protein [Vicinamibacterales bacterium]
MTKVDDLHHRKSLVGRSWLAAAGIAIAAAGLAAQQQPTFRSATHYVSVDVVVTGKDDVPVRDLTKDDFEITENGRRQTIADFAFVSIPLGNRVVDVDAPPAPSSDIGSNASTPRSSRAIVIFVDDSSLTDVMFCQGCPDVIVALKKALTRFLETLSPDDQVALVWQGRSDISQDFTNDIPRLIEAVNSRRAALGMQPMGPRWRPRVDSLKFAVAALAGSAYARRAIVFVGARACNPVPTPRPSFEDVECRDLYDRARKANVPIYALDPRVNPPGGDDTLAELALNTGGLHFMQQSNPLWAIDRIVADNGSFYTLGFYPDPLVRDGKYHDMTVTVKRPGLRVRARDRYLADTATPAKSTPNRDMTKALAAGLDDPSLPIRAFVAPLAPALRGNTRTLVTIEVGYQLPEGGATVLEDEIRVGILALSPDAKVKASFQRPITFTGTWKPTARGTFVINETIDLPADEMTLRVGVTSRSLGRTGTTHVPLDVPNFRKTDVQLSPIVIGSTVHAVDASVGLDALRGLVPFQPTTTRTFAATDRLRVFARVYWGSSDTRVTADVQVDGKSMHRDALTVRTPAPGRREATVDAVLPLGDLSAGQHVLSVIVETEKGKRAVKSVPFAVEKGVS